MTIADQVAAAIVAAAREVSPDNWKSVAIDVASGPNSRVDLSITRTRAYAAYALRNVLKLSAGGAPAIARMVGASSVDCYLSLIDSRLKRDDHMSWWRKDIVARVVEAIEEVRGEEVLDNLIEATKPPPPPPPPLQRPAESPRQIAARRMLEEAVRNTAALPIDR